MATDTQAKVDDPGIVRFREERDMMANLGKLIGIIEDPEMKHSARMTEFVSRSRDRVIRAYEEGRPFIANNYCTAPELGEAMKGQLDDEEVQEEIRHESMLLRSVGALTEAEDLGAIYTSILTVMVQGYYDPEEKYLRCVSTASSLIQTTTMVHELYHALQDQHFDLTAYMEQEESTQDQARARQAVVEGEAEFFTGGYLERHPEAIGDDPLEGMGEMLAQQLEVRLGFEEGERVEILAVVGENRTLEPGHPVVVVGAPALTDGARVDVMDAEEEDAGASS